MKPYQVGFEARPTYLHARVSGARTLANAVRFLKETHAECVRLGLSAVLLEMAFEGPSLDTSDIFQAISQGSPPGATLRRIAYVEVTGRSPKARFAETVAFNRGVNVRLFDDVEAAARWLTEGEKDDRS